MTQFIASKLCWHWSSTAWAASNAAICTSQSSSESKSAMVLEQSGPSSMSASDACRRSLSFPVRNCSAQTLTALPWTIGSRRSHQTATRAARITAVMTRFLDMMALLYLPAIRCSPEPNYSRPLAYSGDRILIPRYSGPGIPGAGVFRGQGYSGDTILVWLFRKSWSTAWLPWAKDATCKFLLAVEESCVAQRSAGLSVIPYLAELVFGHRAVEEATPPLAKVDPSGISTMGFAD